jgi:hypothetical protein
VGILNPSLSPVVQYQGGEDAPSLGGGGGEHHPPTRQLIRKPSKWEEEGGREGESFKVKLAIVPSIFSVPSQHIETVNGLLFQRSTLSLWEEFLLDLEAELPNRLARLFNQTKP